MDLLMSSTFKQSEEAEVINEEKGTEMDTLQTQVQDPIQEKFGMEEKQISHKLQFMETERISEKTGTLLELL